MSLTSVRSTVPFLQPPQGEHILRDSQLLPPPNLQHPGMVTPKQSQPDFCQGDSLHKIEPFRMHQ